MLTDTPLTPPPVSPRKKVREGIAVKINLIVLVVVLLLGASLGAFFISEQHRGLDRELSHRIETFGLYLARSIERADPGTRTAIIESAALDKEIAYIMLKSPAGEILTARWAAQSKGKIREYTFPITTTKHDAPQLFGPIKHDPNGKTSANVAIGVDLSGVTEAKNALYVKTLLVAASGAFLAAIIGFLCIRRLLQRSLSPLVEGIGQFGSGNLLHRVPVEGNDELDQIGSAFNEMACQLALREQALRESERNYREIFNATNDVIFLYDVTSEKIVEANETIRSLYGYDKEEATKLTVEAISSGTPPYSAVEASEWARRTMEEGPQMFEWLSKKKNGECFWTEIVLTPTDIGGSGRILAVVRNIEERKKAESLMQQLVQSQKMESLGRLAGGIAHDFNNLLTPIIGYSELIKKKVADPTVTDKLDRVLNAAERAKALVQQILGFGRKQILEMKTVDMNGLLDSFYHILRRTIRENIALELHLAPERCPVRADRSQVEQVVMNLVVNAQDAIPDAGRITIETAGVYLDEEYARQHLPVAPGRYIMLCVTDNGEGMDKDTQQKVFEPFFTTKGLGQGTGLGLATVHGIVNQHHGHIWVYSEPERGTTFKIYLPVATDAPEEESAVVPAQVQKAREGSTILLVEDDDMVRNLVQEILTSYNYAVIIADGPRQALSQCAGRNVHLLLTDVVMPEMTGPELHGRLRETHPGLKAVFMSGYTNNVIVHHGVVDPGINFIQKPFAAQDLARKIETVLADESDAAASNPPAP